MKLFKSFLSLTSIAIPATAYTHPGHSASEHLHSLLHSEHVMILVTVFVIAIGLRYLFDSNDH